MNLTSSQEISNLLSKYGIKPKKGLGQNFLIDKNVLDKIVKAADLKSSDIILEVGPGIGVLTQELAKKAKQVIAIEKDKLMIEVLKETLKDFKNTKVIYGDILKYENTSLKKYKVVANIPYYLTSPLIRKFLEEGTQPQEIILMVQKEVAQRICAKTPDMSLLAVSVQFYAKAEIISYVSKNCFLPTPKVDSAIIKITPQKKFDVPTDLFFKIVRAGFSQPRKQLVNNLTSLKLTNGVKLTKVQISTWLSKSKIEKTQRSETLSVSDWVNLTKTFKKI